MSISKERIERATRLYCCGERGCERENRTRFPDGCMAHKYADDAKAFLTADAPALLAAKIEGLKEAREITSGGHFRTEVAETPGDAIVFHIRQTRAAIDRRIAELSSQEVR